MIIVKNKRSIEYMRTAGRKLASVFKQFQDLGILSVGITTNEIDQWFEEEMKKAGLKAECKGYAGYKHATCISVNDVVVHGVPSKETVIASGDLVSIDVVGSYKGYCADMARSYVVLEGTALVNRLVETAQRALDAGLQQIKPGALLVDVVKEIQETIEKERFGVIRQFAGHGIGKSLHEEPDVPNYVEGTSHVVLREGMTLAIEPMITEGDYNVYITPDGWTVKTVDGTLAAHVEDTVVVTKTGCEILTRL